MGTNIKVEQKSLSVLQELLRAVADDPFSLPHSHFLTVQSKTVSAELV